MKNYYHQRSSPYGGWGYSYNFSMIRETPLSTHCSKGQKYKDCMEDLVSHSACKYMDRGSQEGMEKIYQFACVKEFEALKDHMDCLFSEELKKNETCLDSSVDNGSDQKCSTGAEMYECFEPAIFRTPVCSSKLKPLLKGVADILVTLPAQCATVESEVNQVDKAKVSLELTEKKKNKKKRGHVDLPAFY